MWGLTKALHKYGTDLTQLAQMGQLDPVIGREKEVELLIQSMLKRKNSHACLVGDAGVGKTAIVKALALKIARYSVPPELLGKKIVSVDMTSIVNGAMGGGDIEKRVKDVFVDVRGRNGEVILFMDDLHNFMREDIGVATLVKLALESEEFKFVGATRVEEYTRYVERDGSWKHMFETIQVSEPSREESIKMVRGIVYNFCIHHGVNYTPTALVTAVDLSKKYFRELCLPRKAIDLIDKAGAKAHMLDKVHVTMVEIEHVVSTLTGFCVEAPRLHQLEDILKRSIIGQDEAVLAVCCSIRRARLGIRADVTRPIGCFLFTGPSGVGKTEMAKVIAKECFGSEAAILSLDSHEFMEQHTVSSLIYHLAEEVQRRPHSIVLLDEIEKAHKKVLDVVLQISKHGRLSDETGKIVDFSNTLIVLTSTSIDDTFKAEVINRFGQVVVFNPLEKEHIEKILEIVIEQFCARVYAEKKIKVRVSKRLKESLLSLKGSGSGAWELKRKFAASVETKLNDEIMCYKVVQGDTVMLDVALTGDVECQLVENIQTGHRLYLNAPPLISEVECQLVENIQTGHRLYLNAPPLISEVECQTAVPGQPRLGDVGFQVESRPATSDGSPQSMLTLTGTHFLV